MATGVIVHRTASHPAWWLFGLGLAFAAWWGLPLVESDQLQNNFFGLFWYSMLVVGAGFWAVPAEQRATAGTIERRYCLLGLAPLWQRTHPVSAFHSVQLDQDPNIFGRDSVWVMFCGPGDLRLVFARFRASTRGVENATRLAADLSALTGLPVGQPGQESA